MEDYHRVHTLWDSLWEEGFAVNRIWIQYPKDGSSARPRPQPCTERNITSTQWIGWTQNVGPSPYRGSSYSEKDMAWKKYQGEAVPRGRLGTTLWFKIQIFQGKDKDKMAGTLHCGEMQWKWFSLIRTIDDEAIPMLVNGHQLKVYKKPLSKQEFIEDLNKTMMVVGHVLASTSPTY